VSAAAAIGEHVRVAGYALAGVQVHAAEDPAEACAAWERLPDDVTCVILTPAAHAALDGRLDERPDLVWAVVPE
jgi:vacuolar-type H+-ATPase subunit F/Vma7